MGYKTILVHAQADPAGDRRLNFALSLAQRFDACLYGVAAETWLPIAVAPDYGYVPGEVIETLERDAMERLARAKAQFEELLKGRPCANLWASGMDYPAQTVAHCAQGADLVVADRPRGPGGEGMHAPPADLVMTAGLPVLILADARDTFTAERVVVAWKDTRESRRAVTDAMPFLRRAKAVRLVQVAPQKDADNARGDLEEAAGRLTRQGVNVAVELINERGHICEALETCAERHGADLIVLGAYGHSRLREVVFGGVTQGFLERASTHVLMSH